MLPTLRRMAGGRYISKGEKKVKNIVKFSKVWMLTLLCALFLGVGIKAEAAPGTVSGLKQVDLKGSSSPTNTVALEWNPAIGSPTKYQVEYCENTTFSGSTYNKGYTPSASPSVVIPELAAGKSYYVRVAAMDSAGTIGTASAPFEVVTAPVGKVTNLKQGKLVSNKITFSWKAVDGANCYDIGTYKYGTTPTEYKFASKPATKTSYSMKASKYSCYAICVYPMRKSASGHIASGNTSTKAELDMFTTPKKVKDLELYDTGSTSSPTAAIAAFSGDISTIVDGYEYEIYGSNNKKLVKKAAKYSDIIAKTTSGKLLFNIKNNKIKNNQFMKIRIRPYVLVNGKTKTYGSWSDSIWFAKYPTKLKAKFVTPGTSRDGVIISWSKVAGAKDYTVYVSRGNRYGKYTKLGNTSATKYSFNSVGGSELTNGTYYYYVVANKKVGKKTYKSDTSWKGFNGFTIKTEYSWY